MQSRLKYACLAWAALICVAAGAKAAPINYGDFIGLNPGEVDFLQVRENSITDPTPLFEAPFRLNNRLLFSPLGFTSSASNGTADTTSGTLGMRIRASAGQFLEQIIIRETGNASLLGIGDASTSATINGIMTVTDINPGLLATVSDPMDVNPAAPYTLPGTTFVEFTSESLIDLTGLGVREIILNFNNNLQTTSQAGTTSVITKKSIEVIVVPEPASLTLLGFASLLVLRRRSRS